MMMSSLQDLINLVRSGDVEAVRTLLSSLKIDLNQVRVGSEVSPLMVACKNGYMEMVHLLLEMGADVNLKNERQWSALMKAVEGGNVEVVKSLMAHGAILSDWGSPECPLGMACKEGNLEVVKALLPKGAQAIAQIDPKKFKTCNLSDSATWDFPYVVSPVNTAAEHGHAEVVKWFLEGGVEVPLGALFLAISGRNSAVVEILLTHGAPVNATGKRGWSALMQASYYGDTAIVRTLLHHHADTNHQSVNDTQSALMIASRKTHLEVIEVLLEADAQVKLVDRQGYTALMCAMRDNIETEVKISVVKSLLNRGADVNIENKIGFTALLQAVQSNLPQIVGLLLERGALINHKDADGNYPLKIAVVMKNIEITKLLLEAGAKADMKDSDGKSLLFNACCYNAIVPIVKLLLHHGVPVNHQDNGGNYALLYAAYYSNFEVVELLLQNGANADLLLDLGSTTALSILQRQAKHTLQECLGSEVAQYPKLRSLLMPAFQMGTTSDDSSEDDLLHMEKNSETTLDTEYPSSELNITPLEASAGCVSQRESQRSNETLSDHDFGWIYEKLRPHSYKWQDIGAGLRFTGPELTSIQNKPNSLLTMLSDWLQWAPEDARGSTEYATLESLRRAVDKAGLGRIAQELNQLP